MTEAIIVALITGGIAVICNIITVISTTNKTLYRIEQLEKKQDKYNNLQERTLINETNIKHLYTEIDDIKKGD